MTVTATVPDLLQRWRRVEDLKDELVKRAEEFFDERAKGGVPPAEVVPIQRAQWDNLLRLALSTTSVKEVQLYIRYQEGREKGAQGWKKDDFGSKLREAIGEAAGLANDDRELAMELVRLFIGYLAREARYRRPE